VPTVDQYQPPLSWRSHAWRMALCLLISAGAWGSAWSGQWREHRPLFWIDLVCGLVAFALVFQRRRWPFSIALVVVALGSVSALAAGPGVLAAVSLATRRRWSQIAVVGLVAVIARMVYGGTQPTTAVVTWQSSSTQSQPTSSAYVDFIVTVVVTAAALSWGMYVGSRRELLWTLRKRAEEAEADQERRETGARVTERSRIAREMHDVVAHRISQVSMQAGAMSFREDLTADELRAGSALIQTQANRALDELRSVLGALRDPDTGAPLDRPQPTFADLAELISDACATGMNIELDDLVGPDVAVPDAAGRTAYRIVQEGLTNAGKHAPGALVRVELSGTPESGLDILVQNPLGFGSGSAAPGSGLGLVGLAERTALMGGRLEHQRVGSTFVLRGWIPWAG